MNNQPTDPTEIMIDIHNQMTATRKTVAVAVTALNDITEKMQEAATKNTTGRTIDFMRDDMKKLRNYVESKSASIQTGQRELVEAHQRIKPTWKMIAAGVGAGLALLATMGVLSAATTVAVVTDLPFWSVLLRAFGG